MKIRRIIPALLIALALQSCKPDLTVPSPSAGEADFSRVIAVGDNFMSGYQDAALFRKGQQLSLPALIVRQMPGSPQFVQPLMPDDFGIGVNLTLWNPNYVTRRILGYRTDCKGNTGLFPLSSEVTAVSAETYLLPVGYQVHNLAVPFLKIRDYFNPAKGMKDGNIYYHRFSSLPGSSTVVSDAQTLQPTFFIAWTGMADIYEYARRGGYKDTIAPANEFSIYLDSLIKTLASNGAKGVIATIPSLESFPFYTLVPPRGLELDSILTDSLNRATGYIFNYQEGKNGFAIEYPIGSGSYRQMGEGEYLLLTIPLDSMRCGKMGVYYGMPDHYSLDSTEATFIHQSISAYNAVIAMKAAQYNLALADMNRFFKTLEQGMKWDGVDFNAEFISGGFFSLDGYHPNQKGYALIANEFIKAINRKYNSTLPPVNCGECDGIRFP